MSSNNDREILITNKEKMIAKRKSESGDYEYYKYEATGFSKDNPCCVTLYEIPPGKSGYPYHYHAKNEEVFFIIKGEGILETYSGFKNVSAGDIIVCPANEKGAHKLKNASNNENLVYLDVDVLNFPEIIYYPHSNKIGVFPNDTEKSFYKKDSDVNYYEGE